MQHQHLAGSVTRRGLGGPGKQAWAEQCTPQGYHLPPVLFFFPAFLKITEQRNAGTAQPTQSTP